MLSPPPPQGRKQSSRAVTSQLWLRLFLGAGLGWLQWLAAVTGALGYSTGHLPSPAGKLVFFFLLVTVGVSCLKPDVAALLGKSLNPALDAARKLVALHSESLEQAEEIPFQLPWKCEFTKK